MFSDVLQISLSTNVVLFGLFPVIIIGLGLAYAVKQWRDGRRQREGESPQDETGTKLPPH